MLVVMARHWEELGKCSEINIVSDTEMGDVGGVSWVCVMK